MITINGKGEMTKSDMIKQAIAEAVERGLGSLQEGESLKGCGHVARAGFHNSNISRIAMRTEGVSIDWTSGGWKYGAPRACYRADFVAYVEKRYAELLGGE